MAQQIILRTDTTTNWASANPILAKGEIGYDELLKIYKMGDGITPWNSLSFTNVPNAQAKTSTLTEIVNLDNSSQIPIGDSSRISRGLFIKPNMDQYNWFQSDFVQSSLGDIASSIVGTGASAQVGTYGINNSENCQGVLQIDTGTTSTGRAGVGSASINHMWNRASLTWYFGARIALEALSVAGLETFSTRIGFGNTLPIGAGDSLNGAYFRYTDSINGGRWECVSVKAGALNAVDSGVVADVNYSIFEIELDGGVINFLINGNQVYQETNPLYIPNLATETFGFGWKIEKSVGATQRNLSADWYYIGHVDNSLR
jgi:hypothetical protein